MSILTVENLLKTYGDKVLFNDISFSIGEKDRIGLIGVNGTGKSSLLRIIAGIEKADQGQIIHANNFHIQYLPQYPRFKEDLTVLDQIYYGDSPLMKALRDYELAVRELELIPTDTALQRRLSSLQQNVEGLNGWETITLAKTILNQLGITNYNEKITGLSGGQKKRVAIARALIQPADLLILDEPTNHLDNEVIEWLEDYLTQYKGALLLVSLDRYFLNRVTNRILELEQGSVFNYQGNYEFFLEKKAEREEQALASEEKRENILRRELAWLRRGARARTTKQKARIQRIEEIRNNKLETTKGNLEIAIGSKRLGKKVLELHEVSKAYSGQKLIQDFSYLVVPEERLGIIGPNGTGKTTLLNIMAGILEPDAGKVDVGQTVKIGYYTQDYIEMDENLRVIEYIKEGAEVIKTADGQLITAAQMLERFLFTRSMQWTYIGKLSGGERRRLYLLRVLMGEPNVLFLDEPTNDLDTKTLTVLEDYLEQFPGVVITVSHDRYFLDKVVDHLLAFEGEGVIRPFSGNYTEYLELKKKEKDQGASKVSAKEEKSTPEKKDRPKKLSYKEQKEWEAIEAKIAELEQQNAQLKADIVQGASDFERVQDLYIKQQKIEAELEKTIDRWAELSLLIEEIEENKSI